MMLAKRVLGRIAVAMLLLGALPGIGAMRTLTLNPGSAQVAFRAYGLGFLPIDGAFISSWWSWSVTPSYS